MNLDTTASPSLKSRVTLFTLAIFLACMWSLAFYGRITVRDTMQDALSRQQYLAASFMAAGINQEFDGRLKALESIADSITPAILADAAALRAALDGRPVFRRMFNGLTFAVGFAPDAVPSGGGAALAQRDCVASVMRSGSAAVCRPFARAQASGPMVGLVVPIRAADGQLIGALGGFSDLGQSAYLNKMARKNFGNTGDFRLIAPQHRLTVMATDPGQTMRPLPAHGRNPTVDRLLDNGDRSGALVFFEDVETLASVRPIPLAGWQVVVTVPTRIAFAPLESARERILLAAMLLSLLTAGVTWLMLDRQLAPMLEATRILAAHSDATQPLAPLPIAHDDEIGALIASFNRLLDDVRQRQQALVESQRWLGVVLDSVQSAVITISRHGIIESYNRYAVQVFGYSQQEAVGRNVSMLMPDSDQALHDGCIDAYLRTGTRKILDRRREVMGRRKDGSLFPIEIRVSETTLNDEKFFVGSINDISFRKKAEEELRIAATAFESQQAMFVTDADTVILRTNQAFTEVTGYTSDEVAGHTPRILQSGQHGVNFYREMWESINRTGRWKGEILGRRKNGEIYPKWLTITAVTDPDGVVTHYVGAHFDITERKMKEDQVRKLAFYDPLTELPNRRLLNDRLSQAMAVGRRHRTYGALMFLDLDNFKSLNDTHGHAVGDLLLVEAALRLKRCVRQVDTVARFGGDEFVVMLSDLHADQQEAVRQATLVANKIRTSLAERYVLTVKRDETVECTVEHECTVSIGVALFFDHTASQDDILKWADTAMYQAKQSGKNQIGFYQS